MLATVFADAKAQQSDFENDFDDHVGKFFLGRAGRLSKEQCAYFEAVNHSLKLSDPSFDIQNEKLPAIVWLRLAFRVWLMHGGVSNECLASYEKWRADAVRRNQLILVAPKPLALEIKGGQVSGAAIKMRPDCYTLDLFLIAKNIESPGLREPWRVVRVPFENYSQESEQIAPTAKSRTFQHAVGVARYEQAEKAIRKAAQNRLLGRKLSMTVDKRTNKYLYEGRREDLLADLKAKKCPVTAGKEVALKLISHFVQCRKGSVASRLSALRGVGRKSPPGRQKSQS